MNIHNAFQYNELHQSKLINLKEFISKFWMHLILCFIFICLVCYIVRSPAKSPGDNSKFLFKTLKNCLTSAGVDINNIIQRDNESSKYTEINWQWNNLNGHIEPMAYVVASNVLDVQNAVICCQLLKVRIVPRSGGHSLTKNGFGDSNSLIVDLSRLNQISVNPNEMDCEIGAGARAALISYTLFEKGAFMIPTGICPTVGLGGLALGGGYGYFTRLLGLVSDNVLEMEMVDAKGKIRIINNKTDDDLFWALRGGGCGSLGIVTKFKLKMYSAPKFVAYGIYAYNFDDFPQFYEAWQSFITFDQPNDIGALTRMQNNKITVEIYKFYFKNNENAAENVMINFNDLLQAFSFPRAIYATYRLLTYEDFLLKTVQLYSSIRLNQISQLANITKHNFNGMLQVKSFFVDKTLDKADINKLHALFRDHIKYSSLSMEISTGQVNNLSSSETAFMHRGNILGLIQLDAISNGTEEISPEAMSAMNALYEDSKAILDHRESYQNYLDQDISDFLERYYGANLKKLIQVKLRIDPDNVFHHTHSIPVSFV